MSMEPQIIFYIFAAIMIIASLLVVVNKDPVKSVFALIVVFVATSGIWLLLGAEFLALVLVLVYVGAVMTLFLFVVMMLDYQTSTGLSNVFKYAMFCLLLTGFMCFLMYLVFYDIRLQAITVAHDEIDNITLIGSTLYTDYSYTFVIAGVILLVAIVASISLVHRRRLQAKRQNIKQQLQTTKQERLRLLDL